MEITVQEAADALDVSVDSISRWYTGSPNNRFARPYHGIDSEVLCEIVDMDHRFLMAFLTCYDIALSISQIHAMFKRDSHWRIKHITVAPVLVMRSPASRGGVRMVRHSYRRIAPIFEKHLEKKNGSRDYTHGSGSILPPPDALPLSTWTFVSALTTKGTRLPRARSTVLANGTSSALPILARSRSRT